MFFGIVTEIILRSEWQNILHLFDCTYQAIGQINLPKKLKLLNFRQKMKRLCTCEITHT